MRFGCYMNVLFWLERRGRDKEGEIQQQQGGGPVVAGNP